MNKLFFLVVAASFFISLQSCSETESVRIVSYNVGVFHKSGEDSTPMVASMMHELNADVIAVEELDSMARRTGKVYQIRNFAELLGEGWDCSYARAMPFQGGSYGVGVAVSPKFHVKRKESVSLDVYDGSEPRALSIVETDRFVVAATHLDHMSDSARLAQAKDADAFLKEEYMDSGIPVFLCGDFNDTYDSPTLEYLSSNGWTVLSSDENTYSSSDPHIRIDYIMVMDNGAAYELKGSSVPVDFSSGDVKLASDHLPVCVDVALE